MTPAWTAPELTALGRLPMHSVTHADRIPLDGRWRLQLLHRPDEPPGADWGEAEDSSSPAAFTRPNLLEADTDRALIESGRSLVMVADHTKWGVNGISSIARLDQADVLITDGGLEPDTRAILTGAVRSLVVVEPKTSASLPELARGH